MSAVLAPVEQLAVAVYVSSAVRPLTEDEILDILRVSRQNNERLGVTGMLLYRDGNFLQVLEGPASVVDSLIQRIRRDPRHDGVILMSRKNTEERQFQESSMAFRNVSKDVTSKDGYSPFLESDFDDDETGEQPQLVFRLLRRFKQDMRCTRCAEPSLAHGSISGDHET
jgi:hypothetical protein